MGPLHVARCGKPCDPFWYRWLTGYLLCKSQMAVAASRRYCMASARWMVCTSAESARSAMVRASFKTRWVPRADQPVKGNVVRAFIGRKGWAPREITVGKPNADAKPASYAGAKAEAFEGVTMQKKEFYGTCYTWTENGVEIKEWFADNGWFNKVIKRTEAGQTAFELSGIASERRAALDWKW